MATADGGREGRLFVAGLERVVEAVGRFDPELVVFFGPDHIRAFTTVIPAFAVVTAAQGYGDWGTPTGAYRVPGERAVDLASAVLAQGVDVTVAGDVRLDHGFGQTFAQLFGTLSAIPVIPIMVNCARPPLAPVRRSVALGRAVGEFFAAVPERVLFVGSGGLSHSPPSLEDDISHLSEVERQEYNMRRLDEAAQRVSPQWDDRFLTALEAQDWRWFETLSDGDVSSGGVGAHEIRTWIAAAAASRLALRRVAYTPVPAWITGMGIAAAPQELVAK